MLNSSFQNFNIERFDQKLQDCSYFWPISFFAHVHFLFEFLDSSVLFCFLSQGRGGVGVIEKCRVVRGYSFGSAIEVPFFSNVFWEEIFCRLFTLKPPKLLLDLLI